MRNKGWKKAMHTAQKLDREAQEDSLTIYDESLAYSTEMKTGDGWTAEDNSADWSAVCDIFHISENWF